MPDPATNRFQTLLRGRLAACIAVRLGSALALWLAWVTACALALLAADYFLALESPALTWLGRGSLIVAAIGLLVAALTSLRKTSRQLAAELDRAGGDRRQTLLAACELSAEAEGGGPATFLATMAVERAAEKLRSLPVSAALPLKPLRRRTLACALVLAAGAAMTVPLRDIVSIPLRRYLDPQADIPPFSRYAFALQPDKPVVLYGDDANLAAAITGPRTPPGVDLLTRVDGTVRRTPCFAEGAGRYAQRIERVTRPVEFCFAVGRARSPWHRVEVNLEPRVILARFTVQSPAYSRLPPRGFLAGDAPLRALAGSRVQLDVTSNRPLKGGRLLVQPLKAGGQQATLAATVAGQHVARFAWTLESDAALSVTVADLQGSTNREPYRLKQQVQPDARPTAAISEPPAYALATPNSRIRLAAYAEDDLGVRRMDLVRGLGGYSDRVRNIAVDRIATRREFERDIDLARLGVVPGQVLEFFVEVADTNPDETGRAVSEVSKVEIVSEEDYAQMMRERTDTEQFMARYQAAREAIEKLRQALKNTEDELARKGSDSELAAKRNALEKALEDAASLFEKLAADFPIYDMEKESEPVFSKAAKELREALDKLREAARSREGLAQSAEELRKMLGEQEQAVNQQVEQAEFVAEVARVLQLENAYLELVAAQAELARRFARYPDPSKITSPEFFRAAEERQKQIREALELFKTELQARAGALNDTEELAPLKQSALRFASAIEELEIAGVMQNAEKAAGQRDGAGSKDSVEKALELMKRLLAKDCAGQGEFAEACKTPKFSPKECNNRTLRQLGQCKRPGMGSKPGQGWGATSGGGEGADGYSGGESTPLNIPMIGPARTAVGAPQGTGTGDGAASGRRPTVAGETATEGMSGTTEGSGAAGKLQLDEAPEKYRDALRKYFESKETP